MNPKEQLELIKRGSVQIIEEQELLCKLENAYKLSKPLKVKLGLDVTAPDIHLGHTVVLSKLRLFQDLGHKVILIIGDFTTLIGDPSGRDKVRPAISEKEIEINAKTYMEQAGKILNLNDKNLEIVRNSKWLSKLSFKDMISIASKITLARVLERDDFCSRITKQIPVFLHELLYPLAQAYDSVAIESDVEVGGTDQTFNFVMTRELQRAFGQAPETVITMPILVGLDGKQKMSKSLGNYVGITEPPFEMFSKIMSIPDEAMKDYFTLLTLVPMEEINKLINPNITHPKEAKVKLAKEIVKRFYGEDEANKSSQQFEQIFSRGELPEEIEEITIKVEDLLKISGNLEVKPISPTENKETHIKSSKIKLYRILYQIGSAPSLSEARRLIKQGAILVDNVKITDFNYELDATTGNKYLLRIGKKNRFVRVLFK